MRRILDCARLVGLLLCLASLAFPQAIIEYATAAAGGSAGGAAGKKVSDGIDAIFRKLGAQSQQAPQPAAVPAQKGGASASAAPSAVAPALETASSMGGTTTRKTALAVSLGSEQEAPAASPAPAWMGTVFEPPRPEPTARDLASVEAGTTREDLVARLGAPSARVLIPEDGQLREVYHFNAGGVHLGTVRLTDGEVSTIEVDPAAK